MTDLIMNRKSPLKREDSMRAFKQLQNKCIPLKLSGVVSKEKKNNDNILWSEAHWCDLLSDEYIMAAVCYTDFRYLSSQSFQREDSVTVAGCKVSTVVHGISIVF